MLNEVKYLNLRLRFKPSLAKLICSLTDFCSFGPKSDKINAVKNLLSVPSCFFRMILVTIKSCIK